MHNVYICESAVSMCVCVYRRQVLKLDQFHLRCLRKIAGIKWQDRTTNVEVLQTCKIAGMEALLLQAQFRWAGHLVRKSHPEADILRATGIGNATARRARQTVQGHSQDQPQAVWNQPEPAKQLRTESIILAYGVSPSD